MDIDVNPESELVILGGPSQSSNDANKKKKIHKVMVDNPSLDLETYISNYAGHAKINRLLYIAERCPSLQLDAYRYALDELKTSLNTARYYNVCLSLNEALVLRGEAIAAIDSDWIAATAQAVKEKTERLDAELRGYKINLIKESIRMGYSDLGSHLYECGDLVGALRNYNKTRDYCTTAKHIIEMCMNVIKVCIELGSYSHIPSYIAKAEAVPDIPEKTAAAGLFKCASGLVSLDLGNFKRAAKSFLEITFDPSGSYTTLLSPNDVAIYGGLCALASFDRTELRVHVFENTSFKHFLELEPQVQELLTSFFNSKYTSCLELLGKMKNDFLLDINLSIHVDTLYSNIRKKALAQYFTPFSSVDMKKMATAFNTSVAELEREIVGLITEKQIQARVDSHNKVLRLKSNNQRSAIFSKSLKMGESYKREVSLAIARLKLIRADMIVRPEEEIPI
ncbi:putative cop9 signalosome complex subunit [Polychytrium aggregatum]|uniref:putative cop9 signalosome complex subunit n=1 Tax=Polychytrium aggregatum TaxID=110093 RepID=UPI0022FE51AD|nr:putative cop9 signalosome complex subunit [Polychytrium aggregatum]KAI9204230.1 putative cop9 signalosome complex subunit [Polychytrium aggregatum]